MKRYSLVILFVVVLITPFFLRLVLGERSAGPTVASGPELTIITSHSEGIRREFADAFRRWQGGTYKNVKFDYISLRTGDINSMLKDKAEVQYPKLHTYQIDLAWGGGDYTFDHDFKNFLQGVALDPGVMKLAFPNSRLNGLPLYDLKNNPPHWFGAALASFGVTYNRAVLRYLKLPDPTSWKDLAAPGYFGWVVLADPTASTSAKTAFMAIVEKAMLDAGSKGESEDIGWARGMGLIRQICANTRTFASGSSLVPGMIASGDYAAGMTIDYYGKTEVEAVGGNRLGYLQPVGETITNPDPIAMLNGAPNSGLAKHFIEFVLSPEGQSLWNKKVGAKTGGPISTNLRRLPIMPSVYDDTSDFTDKDNPYTTSGGFNKSDDREHTFGIIGELIECSCIDCLPELSQTRKEIFSHHAAAQDAQLGMFPFVEKEALRRLAMFKAANPVQQLDLKRAWTEEFKAEYALLRTEAEMK